MTNAMTEQTKANMNSVTLYFTRRFVRGFLAGLTHNDSISFASLESATRWISGIKANSTSGSLDYELADYSFQKYWRS